MDMTCDDMHNKTHEICNDNENNTDSWAMFYKVYDEDEIIGMKSLWRNLGRLCLLRSNFQK